MTDRVKIKALYELPLENLQLLEATVPETIPTLFRNTDLAYKPDSKTLQLLTTGAQVNSSIADEAARVKLFRDADHNQDGFLDISEAKKLLAQTLPEEQQDKIHPEHWLQGLEKLMQFRYRPLQQNFLRHDSQQQLDPLFTQLRVYNDGIYQEDTRHSHSTLPYNGLTKSGVNIGAFLPAIAYNVFADEENEVSLFYGDDQAKQDGAQRHRRAAQAINKLEKVFRQGLLEKEQWAIEGKLDIALTKLNDSEQKIITEELAGKEIDAILHETDASTRIDKLKEFADNERPGFLGFGGGNTSEISLWNYTGRKSNLYFAASQYHYLIKKAVGTDGQANMNLQSTAEAQLNSLEGEAGNFTNLVSVAVTNTFSLGGTFFEPTAYRPWGDAASMDAVGRFFNGLLMLWGGNHAYHGIKQARGLQQAHGLNGLRRIWRQEARLWKPIPYTAMKEASQLDELAYTLTRTDQIIDSISAAFAWLPRQLLRPLTALGNYLKRGLPNLTTAQSATLGKAKGIAKTGNEKLYQGFLLSAAVYYVDEAITGPQNPFEMGFEESSVRDLDLNPGKKIQKFDPVLYSDGPPKIKAIRLGD